MAKDDPTADSSPTSETRGRFKRFDLAIDEASGVYRARVDAAPAGRCRPVEISFAREPGDSDFDHDEPRSTSREIRHSPSAERYELRRVGERLFRAVFVDELADSFRASLERARDSGHGLRLRLRFESAAGLAGLPWEALWDPRTQRFLADEPDVPIVRDIASWEGRRSGPAPETSLHIVSLLPRPAGEMALSGESEWSEIERRLEPLEVAGVTTGRIEPPTRKRLGRYFESNPCHVLHLVAHGEPGAPDEGGALVLQTENGAAEKVSGTRLAQAMGGRSPRLVVLNACYSARSSSGDASDGLAQHLLTQGVSAVVAMRTAIGDDAAAAFAVALYGELARGRTVEQAMIVARRRLIVDHPDEWAIPALYLRAEHLRLFDPTSLPKVGRWTRFWRVVGPLAALLAVLFGGMAWQLDEGPPEPMAPPEHLGKPPELDSHCPEVPEVADLHFVRIEADSLELDDRSLTVETGYCISTTEVTRRDWVEITGGELSRPDWPPTWPITDVTIDDTTPFFDGLEAREKGWDFRLPTPDEWELAGRAGATTQFFFGSGLEAFDEYANAHFVLGNDGWDGPAPVATFSKNDFGLYDVHGNVAEWVVDPNQEPLVDASGKAQALRLGGAWNTTPASCRFGHESWVQAEKGDRDDTGFRVVAVVIDEDADSADDG